MLLRYSALLICLIACLRLEAQSPFIEDYKMKWKNASDYTLQFAQIMPEDYYNYTPTKVEMTYGDQLKHVAGNIVWLCSSYLQGETTTIDPSKTGNSKKEISALLERSFAYAAKTIGNLKEHDLNETVDFFAGKMTRRRILFLLTDHVTHHRGQLVVYLRMKNIEPPAYTGW